jgi:hypothetical protein
VQPSTECLRSQTELHWTSTKGKAESRYRESMSSPLPFIPSFNCDSLSFASSGSDGNLGQNSHNYTIPNVRTYSAAVQPVGVIFKSSSPMKTVTRQNDRNHSDFHLGMAVLGFELRLPCYNIIQ